MKKTISLALGLAAILTSCGYSESYDEMEYLTGPDESCADKCAANQYCINAICVDQQPGGNECYAHNHCQSGICGGIDRANGVYLGKCLSYGGQICKTDADCIEGSCQEGICSCKNHNGCADNSLCDAGTCLPLQNCPGSSDSKCILIHDAVPNQSWANGSNVGPSATDPYFGNMIGFSLPDEYAFSCGVLAGELVVQFFNMVVEKGPTMATNVTEQVSAIMDCIGTVQTAIGMVESLNVVTSNISADNHNSSELKSALETLKTSGDAKLISLAGVCDVTQTSYDHDTCFNEVTKNIGSILASIQTTITIGGVDSCHVSTTGIVDFTTISSALTTLNSALNRMNTFKSLFTQLPQRMQPSCFSMELPSPSKNNGSAIAHLEYSFTPNKGIENELKVDINNQHSLYFTGTLTDSSLMPSTERFQMEVGQCSGMDINGKCSGLTSPASVSFPTSSYETLSTKMSYEGGKYRAYFKASSNTSTLPVDEIMSLYCGSDFNYNVAVGADAAGNISYYIPTIDSKSVGCKTVKFAMTSLKVYAEVDESKISKTNTAAQE